MSKIVVLDNVLAKRNPKVKGASGVQVPLGTEVVKKEGLTFYDGEKLYLSQMQHERLMSAKVIGEDVKLKKAKEDKKLDLAVKKKEAEKRLGQVNKGKIKRGKK